MFDWDPEEITALQGRVVSRRTLVTINSFSTESEGTIQYNFWTDHGVATLAVIDGLTRAEESRQFEGGAIQSVSDLVFGSDLSVRSATVILSALNNSVNAMIRGSRVSQAPIQIYRLYLDPNTHAPIAPAKPRFIGFVDGAPETWAAEGDSSQWSLSCVSHTRELTRTNPAVRSHEDQLRRDPNDHFFVDAANVGEWEISWGEKRGKLGGSSVTAKDKTPGIFGR